MRTMTKAIRTAVLALLFAAPALLFAQGERKDKQAVTYEEIYDEPYSINKLFVHFQPLYGELFVTNVNAGFGVEASYYYQDKADFKAQMRKTYSQKFFDISRDLAEKNSSVDNDTEVYNYFEVGGTYHVKDFEKSSKTKMFLYKKSYKGNKWAARVPLHAEVPCKVRIVYGARLGGIIWDSSTDLSRTLRDQDLTNADLLNIDKTVAAPYNTLPLTESIAEDDVVQQRDVSVFTNVSSKGLYIGGSYSWIKNVAVNFDKFEEGIDDLILTTYFDILYTPSFSIDDIVYTHKNIATGLPEPNTTYTYSVSPVNTKKLGFRLGIEGKFNRQLSWAYGGEIGYRPSFAGRSFFAMFKISFPVFGTQLDYKVESFGK
jgi:hypothetical protein